MSGPHRLRRSARLQWILASALAVALGAVAPARAARAVLLVGDSWARQVFDDGALATVLANHAHADVAVLGDATTEDGSTAAEWATEPRLALVRDELAAHPEIEAVIVFLGGNDFLEGMSGGGWYVGISAEAEDALFDTIEADLGVLIDEILADAPAVEIVLSSYDYPNFVETLSTPGAFVCDPLWDDLGQPTPAEINGATGLIDARWVALAAARPRVAVVRHWGLMQYQFGYASKGIAPGALPPPGDPTLPSPPAAMRTFGWDCFHLKSSGYVGLSERLWNQRLGWRLDGSFADGFETGNLVRWSSSAGDS